MKEEGCILEKDSKLLMKIKKTRFTAHNIQLSEYFTTFNINQEAGNNDSIVKTIAGIDYFSVPLITKIPSFVAIQQTLELCGLEEKKASLKLIDLGCLEGGYSIEFAKNGFKKVLGIEGRKSNYEKCKTLSEYFCLDNLEFRHDDVKNISKYNSQYDVILCLGILYHLDSPVEFLHNLNKLMSDNGVMFLETHFAPKNEYEHNNFFLPNVYPDKKTYELDYSGYIYKGCWWQEYSPSTPENKKHPWSGVSNYRSFVPTLQSLMEALYNTGFKKIYAIENPITHKIQENWYRILWACFK